MAVGENKTRSAARLAGLSLIETILAITVLAVAVIGGSGYRYYAALDARIADVHTQAARVCLLLCESWRGLKGTETFNPEIDLTGPLTFSQDDGPDPPAQFTLLENYKASADGIDYYITLSWKDISADLRALNVKVAWAQPNHSSDDFTDADRLFELTTYVSQ